MKNLKTNKTNLSKTLKRGLSIILATTLVGSFTGCGNNDNNTQSENNSGTQTIERVYDFNFINEYEEEDANKKYDWSNAKEILESKNEKFQNLFSVSMDENMMSENKFELAIFELEESFGDWNFRIVDNKGQLVNNKEYTEVRVINDEYVLLTDESFDEYNKYTLFNKQNGEEKEIIAKYVVCCNGYIITTSYDQEQEKTYYEILNANGTKVDNKQYDYCTYDDEKDMIYAYSYKDMETEILDTTTKKARKIEGKVKSVENGYLIIERPNDKFFLTDGVYYLETLEADLKEVIADTNDSIFFASKGREKPIFEIYAKNEETGEYKYRLFSSTGERLGTEEYDSTLFNFYPDEEYLIAYNSSNNETVKVYDVINQYGIVEADDIVAKYVSSIPLTAYINFENNTGKEGIMDFNKNVIIEPIYDSLFACPIYNDNSELIDCYIVGRIEETNTTVAMTKDLTEIATGDYSYGEITKIATEAIGKMSEDAKILIK